MGSCILAHPTCECYLFTQCDRRQVYSGSFTHQTNHQSSIPFFQNLGSACLLSAFLVFFCQHGSAYFRTFFRVILLIIFLRVSRLFNFILISLLMGISPSPSYQPRVIVESTQREQQMQAEYQLGSGPGDTSWKEGHLYGSRNYISVEGGCKHSIYFLFLYCSVFPFALRDCLGHLQHLNFKCHSMISSTFA